MVPTWLLGICALYVPFPLEDSDSNKIKKILFSLFIQRKRERERDVRGLNSPATGMVSENPKAKKAKNLKLGGQQAHPVSKSNKALTNKCFNQPTVRNSCSSSSILTSENGSQLRKHLNYDTNASDNATQQGAPNKGVSSAENDALVCHLNQFCPEDFIVANQPTGDSTNDVISCSHSSTSEEKARQNMLFGTESEGEGDNLQRAVIPIGPKFQAEVPEWTGPVDKNEVYSGDAEALKFLGTKVWPTEKRSTRRDLKETGSGRTQSCSCFYPGSVDCVRTHTHSARLALQSELGPAFTGWKFDEMGDTVVKKWTGKDQNMFESLIKKYPLSTGEKFWERALKLFPSKSKTSILNYYYNVFNPKHLRQLTESSNDHVESDEDQTDEKDENGESSQQTRRLKTRTLLRRRSQG